MSGPIRIKGASSSGGGGGGGPPDVSTATGVLPIANGGTNASTALSGNSIVISNGTAIVQGAKGTTTTLLHGNAAGSPTYSAASLTADVTGVLPVANGGTNSNTALSGSSIAISNGTALVQGAAGTATTLLHGNAAGAPTYAAASLTADVAGVLPVANGGTNSSTALSGSSIAISNGTALVQGAAGTTTTLLHGNAAGAPTYSAASLTADVTGVLPVANGGTNSATALSGSSIAISNGTALVQGAAGTTTTVLHGNASGAPTYSAISLTADVTGILPVANLPAPTLSVLTYAATVDIDVAATTSATKEIDLTGNLTLTTSNKAAGLGATIILVGDGTSRTLTFPAWRWMGVAPDTLPINKIMVISLFCRSTTDASIVASYSVEP